MNHGARHWYAGASLLGALVGCSAMSASDGDDAGSAPPSGSSGGSSSMPGGMQDPEPKPEEEVDEAFQAPVVSGRWVWTANPTSGVVALIDAESFAVQTVDAGAGPTYLAALPVASGEGSRAIVINSVSEDATLLAAGDDGALTASVTLPVHGGANAWAITPNGRFAIAWSNAASAANADPSQGFQDITVLDVGAEKPLSKRLSVGYRPSRVFMDDDNRYAYFVTEAGIDVVDLEGVDGPIVEREIELSARPASDTAKRDVNVTPDGAFAFVSRLDKDYVTVVNVAQGTFKDIQLPGVVTDLDLSADASVAVAIVQQPTLSAEPSAAGGGAGGQAGAGMSEGGGTDVELGGGGGLDAGAGAGNGGQAGTSNPPQRGQQSLAVLLPVATIFDAPGTFDSIQLDERFASVELGPEGSTALLYQNGVPNPHLTLLDLTRPVGANSYRTVDLRLPVFAALAAPDGAHAIVLLKPPADSAKPGAFAVVPVTKDLPPSIQGTAAATVPADLATAQPAMVALDAQHAVVTVSDGQQTHVAYLVSMPSLTVDAIALASAPLRGASGIVPEANQAFVAQQHPEGRITFIDLDSGEQHTLTGFELSSQVKQ